MMVYVVPVGAAGNSVTGNPATNWSLVISVKIGVVVVEPVYILNGPTAFVSNVSLTII